MRVATRRMRTALWIAKPYLDRSVIAHVRKGLRKTARVLGAVRDMDVFREKTEGDLAASRVDRKDLTPLMSIWDVEHTRRRNDMLDYLSGKKYARFKETCWAQIQEGFPERPAPHVLRDILPKIVRQRLDKVIVRGDPIGQDDLTLKDYHRLRIDVKRLRYTLEFFRDLLGPEAAEAIEALKILQDYFGELQDAVVASGHIRAASHFGTWESPKQVHTLWKPRAGDIGLTTGSSDGMHAYLASREAEIKSYTAGAPDIWQRFQATDAPQKIRNAAAALV
jgi:CHAD domain-containing protein